MFDEKQVRQILRSISVLVAQALAMLDDLQQPRLVWDSDREERSKKPFDDLSDIAANPFPEKYEQHNGVWLLPTARKEVTPKNSGVENEKNNKLIRAFSKSQKKELLKLPNQLQLKIKKALAKAPRFHKGIYEKRARINGIDIYGSSTDPEVCETQFFDDLLRKMRLNRDDGSESTLDTKMKSSVPFAQFAEIWFTEVFQPTVVPDTYNKEYGRYRNHILPALGKKKLAEIRPIDCVLFFNALQKKNIERTAESIYNILDRIFRFAVDSEILQKNPLRTVKPIKHERENGVPLTEAEEKQLLVAIKGHKYEAVIVLALYTGLRPCEYETARIEGDFIVA